MRKINNKNMAACEIHKCWIKKNEAIAKIKVNGRRNK
jgi:hypothetical protein